MSQKMKHAVVKLRNGEELICKVETSVVDYFDEYKEANEKIRLYQPLKAETREYYTKDRTRAFEETIMTSWLKFAWADHFDINSDEVVIVVEPSRQQVIDNYDDLALKYHTYDTNPELAYDLYGIDLPDDSEDDDDDIHEDDILDNLDDDEDED